MLKIYKITALFILMVNIHASDQSKHEEILRNNKNLLERRGFNFFQNKDRKLMLNLLEISHKEEITKDDIVDEDSKEKKETNKKK